MSELDDIKARAKEHHDTWHGGMDWDDWSHLEGLLSSYAADLDRAISIAASLKLANDVQADEIRRTRADVLKLMDYVRWCGEEHDSRASRRELAGYEQYEQYR